MENSPDANVFCAGSVFDITGFLLSMKKVTSCVAEFPALSVALTVMSCFPPMNAVSLPILASNLPCFVNVNKSLPYIFDMSNHNNLIFYILT